MNSRTIQKRQNEEGMLKVQYAARVFFNSAEAFNYLGWILCIISAISVFLPDTWNEYVLYGIPFAAELIGAVFCFLASQYVKQASKLRGYFDAYVLDIQFNRYTEADIREIRERTETVCQKNWTKAMIQIANNGGDSPPGVRDWYVFPKLYKGIDAQFEAQRQNTWWNKKLHSIRTFAAATVFVVIMVIFVVIAVDYGFLRVLLCSAGILLKTLERIVENGRYHRISALIEGAEMAVEGHPTREGVERLQLLIDKRRTLNVLELGWAHKKISKKLTELYHRISS